MAKPTVYAMPWVMPNLFLSPIIMFIDSKTGSNTRVFRQFYEYFIGRNVLLLKTVSRLEEPGPDEKQPGEESSQSP